MQGVVESVSVRRRGQRLQLLFKRVWQVPQVLLQALRRAQSLSLFSLLLPRAVPLATIRVERNLDMFLVELQQHV